jgi:hypothetical protein
MEGFTIILIIGWLLLVGSFVGMYFLDQATKKISDRRAAASESPAKNR